MRHTWFCLLALLATASALSGGSGTSYGARKATVPEPAAPANPELKEASPSIFAEFKLEQLLEIREQNNCPHTPGTLGHAETKKRIAVLVGELGDPQQGRFAGARELSVSELQSTLSSLDAGKQIFMMQQCPDPHSAPRCTASGEPVIQAVQETLRKWNRPYTAVRERCAGDAPPRVSRGPPKSAMQQAREFAERYVSALKSYAANDATTRIALIAIASATVIAAILGAIAAPPAAPAAPAAGDKEATAEGKEAAAAGDSKLPTDEDAPLESSD